MDANRCVVSIQRYRPTYVPEVSSSKWGVHLLQGGNIPYIYTNPYNYMELSIT